jgi:polyamine oxidase
MCTYLYRLEGLQYEVLQWCICRLEAWFATDVDNISLQNWDQVCSRICFKYSYARSSSPHLSVSREMLADISCMGAYLCYDTCLSVLSIANLQEHVLTGGHGLMVNGYDPVIRALSRDLDIHLNHRYAQHVSL